MPNDLIELAERTVYNPEQPIGSIEYASSDGCSADVGVLLRMSETGFIWCGEITRKEAEAAGIDDAGWHIVLHKGDDRRVIGQVPDSYAGVDFVEAIAAALNQKVARDAQ
jgi:hypothetical protein